MNRSNPTLRNAGSKVLDLVEALSAYTVSGVSNKRLGELVGCSPSWVSQNVAMLVERGWAHKEPKSELYFPTPAMARVFGRVMADITAAEARLANMKHNFAGALARD